MAAAGLVMEVVRAANGYFQHNEPWALVKRAKQSKAIAEGAGEGAAADSDAQAIAAATAEEAACMERLGTVMHLTLESLRVAGILLQPVVPKASSALLDSLGASQEERSIAHASECVSQPEAGDALQGGGPLAGRRLWTPLENGKKPKGLSQLLFKKV